MNSWSRSFAQRAVCLLLAAVPLVAAAQKSADAMPRWVASWAAAPQSIVATPLLPEAAPAAPAPAVPTFDGGTLRQRLQPTLGGERVRIRFSNLFGKVPLRIVAASVARGTGGDDISPATLQRLRFGGRTEVAIAPGAEAWSDAAKLGVEPGQAVVVSFRVDAGTPFATVHHLPTRATWTVPGDAVMQAQWPGAASAAWNHVVTGLDVATRATPRVVVAFGDSITEGVGADDAQALPWRYPDRLATHLRERVGTAGSVAVINAGIAGNRLLADGVGPRGLDRFRRDVLAQSGVTHAVVLIGINDIGLSVPPSKSPDARQLAAGLEQLVGEARAKGVKVLLGTLLPFKGSAYWSAEKEARRQALNRWIRGRQGIDAVVDFDTAMRSPADPLMLNPLYDSGDHLHPGNAGYAAMADAIDPKELRE